MSSTPAEGVEGVDLHTLALGPALSITPYPLSLVLQFGGKTAGEWRVWNLHILHPLRPLAARTRTPKEGSQ